MAGLGDLFATLLGGNKVGGDEARDAGLLANTAKTIVDTLARIPGTPFNIADIGIKEASLIENRDAVMSSLAEGDITGAINASGTLNNDAKEASLAAINLVVDGLKGKTAQSQLEAIIGAEIPPEATTTKAVMDQLALLTQANEAIQALSVASEVASVGQIDRIGSELRSYLDYSGVSQISGFGYGQILASVIGTRMNQELLAVTRPAIPSVMDLVNMRNQELITEDSFMEDMAKLGYPDETARNLYTVSHNRPTPLEFSTMRLRGVITPDEYLKGMRDIGYDETDASNLFSISKYYPGPQDWIRFAVRDAFNPDVVESAGLNDNFPEDIVPLAEKGGVSEDVMRLYWRAHWNLPSPNQAFEMLHRGLITMDELRNLLKAADYAPGYIDSMVGIAYTPYTRVDARRMYETGVLDDDGYLKALKEIGYDDEHAANLLKFAQRDTRSTEKDLSQAQLMKAYSLGKLPRQDLMKYLMNIGYDSTEAGLLIDLEDAKKEEDLLKEKIAVLDWYYGRGDIDSAGYLNELNSEGIPREKAQYYLSRAALNAEKSAKTPTKADTEKWYKKGYISESDAVRYLRQMKYRDTEISLYLKEWKDEAHASTDESNK